MSAKESLQPRKFYTWSDPEFRDFMFELLQFLEPVRYDSNTIICNELDEFGEVTFIQQGLVAVGYEINKRKKYPVKLMNGVVIGGYGVTFDQRCSFIYFSGSFCKGYFVRKLNWKALLL